MKASILSDGKAWAAVAVVEVTRGTGTGEEAAGMEAAGAEAAGAGRAEFAVGPDGAEEDAPTDGKEDEDAVLTGGAETGSEGGAGGKGVWKSSKSPC